MAPILLFLVAITLLSGLSKVAGLFDVAAQHAARLAHGRTSRLFILVAVLATVTTVLLGLDTTAVLLTPVVLLQWRLIPWRLAVLVLDLALVVETALRHGGGRVAEAVVGTGSALGDLVQVAGVGAVASNLVNNLPPSVRAAARHQLGPMVLLWGSLATLLWRERLRARGLDVSAGRFAAFGLIGVPLVLACATTALWVSG